MANPVFPETPAPAGLRATPIEIVVPREPLVAIRQALAISLHGEVNERRHKRSVFELFKISRRIENEGWLHRRLQEQAYEAWLGEHL